MESQSLSDEGKTLRILGEKNKIKNNSALNKASSNGILRTVPSGSLVMDSMDEDRQLIRKGQLGISGAATRGSELWFFPFFLPQYKWCGRLDYCSLWKDCTSQTHCPLNPPSGRGRIPTLLNLTEAR